MQTCISLGPSVIAGTGCFAARHLEEGEEIGEYTGERITGAEAERRYAHRRGHTYLFGVADDLFIDGETQQNPLRFLNHSCEPNCSVRQDGTRIFVTALTGIASGQELTLDYNLEVGPGEEEDHPCRCGAQRCRGTQLGR